MITKFSFLPTSDIQGFTAVILTYDRITALFKLVQKIAHTESLTKIVVIWNNQVRFSSSCTSSYISRFKIHYTAREKHLAYCCSIFLSMCIRSLVLWIGQLFPSTRTKYHHPFFTSNWKHDSILFDWFHTINPQANVLHVASLLHLYVIIESSLDLKQSGDGALFNFAGSKFHFWITR